MRFMDVPEDLLVASLTSAFEEISIDNNPSVNVVGDNNPDNGAAPAA